MNEDNIVKNEIEQNTEQDLHKLNKKKKKKKLIIAIVIVSILSAISYVITYAPEVLDDLSSLLVKKQDKIPPSRM